MPDLYLRVKRLERRVDDLEEELEKFVEDDESDNEKAEE